MQKTFLLPFLMVTFVACTDNQVKQTEQISSEKDSIHDQAYIGPHHEHHKLYEKYRFKTEAQWDSLNEVTHHGKVISGFNRNPDYKVFGWHIYPKGTAYQAYDFELMWGVSYFSYLVDPATGSYTNIYQWKTTDLVSKAHEKGCKVYLTVSNFGAAKNKELLDNRAACETMADSLIALLDQQKADGVNIDFEGVPSGYTDKYSECVNHISKKLKAHNKDLQISVALYAVDYHKVFDIKAIDQSIDFYTLMGYDYYGGFSKTTGPVTPLNSSKAFGENSLSASVDYYLDQGIDPSKLIVGLPYYGAEWKTDGDSIPAKVKKFVSHPTYEVVQNLYVDSLKYKFTLDEESATAYTSFTDAEGNTRQIWCDDSFTLAKKYDWIKAKQLSGVGIWAIAYGTGHDELWTLLGEKFGKKK